MGVVTGSVNVYKNTVMYFCWHLLFNLEVFKESHATVPGHHSYIRLEHCYLRTRPILHGLLWAILQPKERAGKGGPLISTVPEMLGSRGQHYCRGEQ